MSIFRARALQLNASFGGFFKQMAGIHFLMCLSFGASLSHRAHSVQIDDEGKEELFKSITEVGCM